LKKEVKDITPLLVLEFIFFEGTQVNSEEYNSKIRRKSLKRSQVSD